MSTWKKVGRGVGWVASNAAWTWVAWTALHGSGVAGNLLKFGLWFMLAQALLLAVPTKASARVGAKGPPVPLQAMLLFDVLFGALLAAFGWFGYAAIAVVSGFMQGSAYVQTDKPAPVPGTEAA